MKQILLDYFTTARYLTISAYVGKIIWQLLHILFWPYLQEKI